MLPMLALLLCYAPARALFRQESGTGRVQPLPEGARAPCTCAASLCNWRCRAMQLQAVGKHEGLAKQAGAGTRPHACRKAARAGYRPGCGGRRWKCGGGQGRSVLQALLAWRYARLVMLFAMRKSKKHDRPDEKI